MSTIDRNKKSQHSKYDYFHIADKQELLENDTEVGSLQMHRNPAGDRDRTKKVQYIKVRLYPRSKSRHVGLWFIQCEGQVFGLGKGLGIECKITSPSLILPGKNRTKPGKLVDCIVIQPGIVTVDNHG